MVERVLFVLKDIGTEINIKLSFSYKLPSIETDKIMPFATKMKSQKVVDQQERNLYMAGVKRKGAPERRKHPKA